MCSWLIYDAIINNRDERDDHGNEAHEDQVATENAGHDEGADEGLEGRAGLRPRRDPSPHRTSRSLGQREGFLMDLHSAEALAVDLLMHHGLEERGWTFRFDNAPRRFGFCNWRLKVISLSRKLTKLNGWDEVRETLLHEVAHALDAENRGRSDHSREWVKIAQSIGCTGRRCYSTDVVTPPMRSVIDLSKILGDD